MATSCLQTKQLLHTQRIIIQSTSSIASAHRISSTAMATMGYYLPRLIFNYFNNMVF